MSMICMSPIHRGGVGKQNPVGILDIKVQGHTNSAHIPLLRSAY